MTDVPPTYRTNPSSRRARTPVALLALLGFGISTYLALFQYEAIDHVWEPFFGDGSWQVLTSPLSTTLPVSDAALGAATYLLEFVTDCLGGHRRWQDRPWAALLLGAIATVMMLVSVGLVVSQPLLTGTFCTLCLASAGLSFVVGFFVFDEARAAATEVMRVRRVGMSWIPAVRGYKPASG